MTIHRGKIVVSSAWLLVGMAIMTGCQRSAKTGDTSDNTAKHDATELTSPSRNVADPEIAAESPTDPQVIAESPADPVATSEPPASPENSAKSTADPEIVPESIGLDPSAKSLGPDANGVHWFKTPVRGPDGQPIPDKFDHWTYKPKTETLYQATRGDDGQWKMVERPAVTAESLKLGPGAKYAGKDPLGRYWFTRVGHSARVLYDPRTKKLFRAVQQDDGEWKLTEISSTQP